MQQIVSEADFNINNGFHAIKFGATWCGPCKKLTPLFNKIEEEFNNVHFSSIDIDDIPILAQKYKIRSVPTIILFNNGFEIARINGLVLINPLRKMFRDNFKSKEMMPEIQVA